MSIIRKIFYFFYYLLITAILNGENLIISNGEIGLVIKQGEEITIKYKNRDITSSLTGEFLRISQDNVIINEFNPIDKISSEIEIDIANITSIRTKVPISGSLSRKIENYTRIFGLLAGIASAGYVMAVGDWSSAIGFLFGLIITPVAGIVGAIGGGGIGVVLAILSHENEYSKPNEYILEEDSWKIMIP